MQWDLSYNQNQAFIKRKLIKSLLKATSLDEKLALSKSALFMVPKKYTQNFQKLDQINQKTQTKIYKLQVEIQTEEIDRKVHQQVRPQQKFGYLKQTAQFFTQTQHSEPNSIDQGFLKKQISMTQSIILNDSQKQKFQQKLQTCCSFSGSLFSKTNFNQTKIFDCDENNLENFINTLKGQVENLKVEVTKVDKQKNWWKKKAEKYQSKLKGVSKQMKRFETAYSRQT